MRSEGSKSIEIMARVCRAYQTTPEMLRSYRRSNKLNAARREFIRLADAQNWSTTVIGRLLNRDHSTVCYHLERLRREEV